MKLRNYFEIVRALAERQEGQTMAEYGVVLAVITVLVIAAIAALAAAITGRLTDVAGILGG